MSTPTRETTLYRLMSYSAAAGLGAFSFGPGAQANNSRNIHVTVLDSPVTIGPDVDSYDIDFDDDGFVDASIISTGSNIQVRSFGFDETGPSAWETDNWTLSNGNDYYVFSFPEGFLIDPDQVDVLDPNNSPTPNDGSIFRSRTYDLAVIGQTNALGTGRYVAFEFEIGNNPGESDDPTAADRSGSTTHFGWAQIDGTTDPGTAIISAFGYRVEPDQNIEAGEVPEPASLALLAAGGGALALRRRKV